MMKTKPIRSLLTLMAVLCAASAMARARTIARPQYVWNSTEGLEVESITLSDTATTVAILYTGRPKERFSIAPTTALTATGGLSYPLLRAYGIEPGKKVRLPESGQLRLSLVFKPVAEGTSEVTLCETATPRKRGKTIAGIRLDGQLPPIALPQGVGKLPADTASPLPEPTYKYGVAKVNIHLLEYQPAMDGISVRWKQLGIFQPNISVLQPVGIDSTGCSTVSLPVAATTPLVFRVSPWPYDIICYAEAGRTTDIYVSLRELCRRGSELHKGDRSHGPIAYFTGPHALLAQELTDTPNPWWSMWEQEGIEHWSAERYAEHVENLHRERSERWGKLPVSRATRDAMYEKKLHFKPELDVRGMRVDEALTAVTYFIDDAIQLEYPQVRILHGTGTGALREAIRQYLATVPGVSRYRDEHVQFGGAGITVVKFA